MIMYHHIKFGCHRIDTSEDIVESHFDPVSHCCDLDLEDSKDFSPRMTFWLMMLHKHTKFGNKMSCGLEDIWTIIH